MNTVPKGESRNRRTLSRLQFLQMTTAGTAGLVLGNGTAGTAAAVLETKPSNRPNIIFITTDEQRFDALGVAGNEVIQTPHLDRMAREGVHFSNTYCQGPLCQPARASLLTGRYVHEHGQTWNQFDMNPEWPTMLKQLQKAGYRTALHGKTHFYSGSPSRSQDFRRNADFVQAFGLDEAMEEFGSGTHLLPNAITPYTLYLKERNLFETYRGGEPAQQTRRREQMYDPSRRRQGYRRNSFGRTSELAQEHHLTSFIADRSIDWLKNFQEKRPFFLWVSFVAPHPPFVDDPAWAAVYRDAIIPPGPTKRPEIPDNAWGRYLDQWMKIVQTEYISPELMLGAARHYYGMVSLVDQKVGDIRKAVEQLGWADNTWFIFTSDHGEMLGDHGLVYKNVFYKGSVRVPHIIRPPGGMKPMVIDAPAQHIDITATILDVAGAAPPEGMRGRSVVPLLKGTGKPREVAFSELAGHRNEGNFLVMAATHRYRYVYDSLNDIGCELFDLKEDPDELNNRVDDPAFAKLRRDLHGTYIKPFLAGEIG